MRASRAIYNKGFTLVELLIVVLILASIVVIAQPNFSNNDSNKVNLASAEVANALRFAQSEARRSGEYYGFRLDNGSDLIRLFNLQDPTTSPTESYSVYHPLDKNLYAVDLANGHLSKGVSATAAFKYSLAAAIQAVAFTPFGAPVSPEDLYPLLEGEGSIVLTLGNHTQTVLLCAETGRVIVQQNSETCL